MIAPPVRAAQPRPRLPERMELNQLRAFAAIVQHRHLTRAAEHLHLSQPAVSHQIKALEDELGLRLFERTSTGLTPTAAALELQPFAQQALNAVGEVLARARGLRGGVAGTVRLGTIIDPLTTRLSDFLRLLVERFPQLAIETRQSVSGKVLEAVRKGELDAGYFLAPDCEPDLTAIALAPVRYSITGPKAWQAKMKKAGWPEIARLPWIGTAPHSSQTRLMREMFESVGLRLTSVIQSDQETSMRSLAAAGVGLCLMREQLALEGVRAGELFIWPKHTVTTTLWLIHLQTRAHDPMIAALTSVLREVWG